MNGYILEEEGVQCGGIRALEVQPLPKFDWSLGNFKLLDSGGESRWLWVDVSVYLSVKWGNKPTITPSSAGRVLSLPPYSARLRTWRRHFPEQSRGPSKEQTEDPKQSVHTGNSTKSTTADADTATEWQLLFKEFRKSITSKSKRSFITHLCALFYMHC